MSSDWREARSDEDLFDRYRYEGDQAAFGVLQSRYHNPLFGHAYRTLRDREWAEDATQDTWVRVHEKAHVYDRTQRPFKVWIWAIHHNIVHDHWRCAERARLRYGGYLDPQGQVMEARPMDEGVADPQKQAEAPPHRDEGKADRERRVGPQPCPVTEAVADCLRQLRFELRMYWLLRYVEGFKVQEIAEIMGVNAGRASRRLTQGEDSMLGCMKQKGFVPPK